MTDHKKMAIIIFIIIGINTYAQGKYGEIGKLYTNDEADKLYGPVIESIEIPTADLVSMLDKCENYMMFTIKNHELIIANDYREVLTRHKIQLTSSELTQTTDNNDIIDDNEILNVYSKSKILELIERGGEQNTAFEKRNKVYTMKGGPIILEMSRPCPPWC